MAEWWSIEVFHADQSARRWKDSYEDALIEAALAHGVGDWAWHEHRTGVVLEVQFGDDAAWEAFRALPAGPRRRGPKPSADALARPEPVEEKVLDLTEVAPPGL